MNENDMQHGSDWAGQDLTGWQVNEKMDGARAYWDGHTLWSRGGIACPIPESFRQALPAIALDCELYDGPDPKGRYRCGAAIKNGKFAPSMRLVVFDAPTVPGDYQARMQAAQAVCAGTVLIEVLPVVTCRGYGHAVEMLTEVKSRGGEGLMFRRPGLAYLPGRTAGLLKMKSPAPNCY